MTDPKRKKIRAIEAKMMKDKDKLAKLRSRLKPEPVADFALQTSDGKTTSLSALFGDRKELILIHNMGSSCPYCTLWADGFNGLVHHLENIASFVVESPERPKTISAFKQRRGWNFEMVSSFGSPFRKKMGYEDSDGYIPGVSVFVKKADKIFRVNDSRFGPGDNFCVAWDFVDLIPNRKWEAKFRY